MTIPDHVVQARREARSAAARIVFHPSHLLDEREGGCSACEAQGSALARVCAAVLRDEEPACSACGRDELTCSKAPCAAVITDRSENDDLDDTFCPTCRMNVSAADHNDAQCEAEYQA